MFKSIHSATIPLRFTSKHGNNNVVVVVVVHQTNQDISIRSPFDFPIRHFILFKRKYLGKKQKQTEPRVTLVSAILQNGYNNLK